MVTPLPITTIEDIAEARHLCDVIEVVYGKRPKLSEVVDDIRLCRQEAELDEKDFLNNPVQSQERD